MRYIIAAGALVSSLVTIWALVKSFGPLITAVWEFLSDWNGTPGRPGVPRRPGMMERMDLVEEAALDAKHNTESNDGGSSHDQIVGHLERIEGIAQNQHSEFHDYTLAMEALYEETRALAYEHGMEFPPWPWEIRKDHR